MTIEQFITKVHSIAKIGLKFSKDPYALENYQQLFELSHEMLNQLVTQPLTQLGLYQRDIYPTPSVSVRTLIFNEKNQLLMVKEAVDHHWSIPGGWCDVFESAKDNAIKECLQEAGVEIEIQRLLAISFRDNHKVRKESLISEYCLFFLGKVISGDYQFNHEVEQVEYFDLDKLPLLSRKTSPEELHAALDAYFNNTVNVE